MRGTRTQLGTVVFWFALILCALIDFTSTILSCVIVIGIGWAGWYASRLELFAPQPADLLRSRNFASEE
jgi:hypothetical protein